MCLFEWFIELFGVNLKLIECFFLYIRPLTSYLAWCFFCLCPFLPKYYVASDICIVIASLVFWCFYCMRTLFLMYSTDISYLQIYFFEYPLCFLHKWIFVGYIMYADWFPLTFFLYCHWYKFPYTKTFLICTIAVFITNRNFYVKYALDFLFILKFQLLAPCFLRTLMFLLCIQQFPGAFISISTDQVSGLCDVGFACNNPWIYSEN